MIDGTLQYLLIKLAEESGELVKVASKAAIFGVEDKKDSIGPTNMNKLALEYNDITSIMCLIQAVTGQLPLPDDLSVQTKLDKLVKWTYYSAEKGGVSDAVANNLAECVASYKELES